jgi:hypothetical protein
MIIMKSHRQQLLAAMARIKAVTAGAIRDCNRYKITRAAAISDYNRHKVTHAVTISDF